ncbi:hypothetical protein ACSBLW_03105 [Thioclava sp. FR2]|uniref:hypothetical protein n=1 Tax=Thioclava sp. FR2 TaxID=3445780 RepID=UPI003EBDBD46
MTQVRRVRPVNGMPRTDRPDARATVSTETRRARQAVVVPLFPQSPRKTETEDSQIENIFADLGDLRPVDARVRKARIRVRACLPSADIPRIDNMFDDSCPEISDECMSQAVSLFRAKNRRPMEAVREEISAYHRDNAQRHVGEVLQMPWPRVAASVFGMLSLIHLGSSQAF